VQKQLGHSSISITVDIYGHWIPGEGKMDLTRILRGPKGKTGAPLVIGYAAAGISSAKFDRMDRVKIIKEIGSIFFWFGQMFGQKDKTKGVTH